MRADLHLHSARSFDGSMSRAEIAACAKARGLDAVAVCDHDVSPEAADFETRTIDGVLFIPAVEYSTNHGHLLGLFLSRPVAAHENERIDLAAAAEEIHAAGGLCVLAHPFEQAKDFAVREDELCALLPLLDGIEVFNSRADYKYGGANRAAAEFAARHRLACVTAGSDAHRKAEVGNAYLELDCPCETEAIKAAVQSGGGRVVGQSSPRRHIALSQLTKAKKQRAGLKRYFKSAALLCIFTVKDLFKR